MVFMKKNHKLIDMISVSLFLFCLSTLALLYILSYFNFNEYLTVWIVLISAAIISHKYTNRLNAFLHELFNINQ